MTVYFYSYAVKDPRRGDVSFGDSCIELPEENMSRDKTAYLMAGIVSHVERSTSDWKDSYRVVITALNKI
jgi:hypothetical protein